MPTSIDSKIKLCWRVFRILVLFLGILLFLIVWFEFPLQQETFRMNLVLQKQYDDIHVELKSCLFKHQLKDHGSYKMLISNSKPFIPQAEKKKIIGFEGIRLVHIDLKGAPPKIDYLLKLLPLFKEMGANGILLEYEDMFPYYGALRNLSSKNAYSYADIETLSTTAYSLKMEIIPLIQALGHFEFVLKHDEFRHLRETSQYPNMPCPLHEETQELVLKMVNQVLHLHPNITRIHLGADEAYNLKECDKCKTSEKSKEHLFLHHMLPILEHVRRVTKRKVKPLIWDDMLRKWSIADMQRVSPLAEIMVWNYVPNLSYSSFPADMWDKYAKVFDKIWIASSFKGARAVDNNLVPIPMHLHNHESWMRVVKKLKNKVAGIAITGWARYDHYATLCELLPASLPTLALSLSVLKEGSYKLRSKDSVEALLGFPNGIMIEKDMFGSWDTSIPNFPGGDVYALIGELENHVSWYDSAKMRLDSWANIRQVNERKISFFQVNEVSKTLKQLGPSLKNFRTKCQNVLNVYFFEDTVDEWIRDKVDVYIDLSGQLVEKVKHISVKLNIKIEL